MKPGEPADHPSDGIKVIPFKRPGLLDIEGFHVEIKASEEDPRFYPRFMSVEFPVFGCCRTLARALLACELYLLSEQPQLLDGLDIPNDIAANLVASDEAAYRADPFREEGHTCRVEFCQR